jgi:GntR family transcriptional regulator
MTTRPVLVVTADDPTPAYEQLRRQFVSLIRSRTLAAGERLPPVRQLAADLRLAPGTVARTYRELESAGLVRTSRGGGTRVIDSPVQLTTAERRRQLDQQAAALVQQARLIGAEPDAVLNAVRQALDR